MGTVWTIGNVWTVLTAWTVGSVRTVRTVWTVGKGGNYKCCGHCKGGEDCKDGGD